MTTSTNVERRRTLARRTLLALTTALCSGLAAPSYADTPHPNRDGNGVDLTTGEFNLRLPIASIGSGQAELPLVAYNDQQDNWSQIYLIKTASGSSTIVDVYLGDTTDRFVLGGSATSAISSRGTGAVFDGDSYRAQSGVVITFQGNTTPGNITNLCDSVVTTNCSMIAGTMSGRTGLTVSFGWDVHENCASFYNDDGSINCTDAWRLASVSNGAGYSINWLFSTNSVALRSNPAPAWYQRTSATLKNAAVTASSWPTVTYAYPSSGVATITNPAGETWRISTTSGRVTAIRRPTASSDTTTIAYASGARVSSVTSDGVTTGYTYTVSGTTATMVVTDALSNQMTIVSDLAKYRPTSITNAAGKVNSLSYDSLGQLTEVTNPEGDKVQYAYDARGNVTTTTRKAKAGSGLADLVTTAGYDAGCTNAATCNQPNWTKDAKGNQTDYAYDATTGQVTTVTLPAATGGGTRPLTSYSYAATGLALLTGVSACQTAASCAGTADAVNTAIGYDANLNVTSVTKGAGTGSPSTTVTASYDKVGNLLTLDGPLAGSADTVTWRYDAMRRRVGAIAPDPDGAGPRVRRAVRTTYNADGLATLTELGTVGGTSDSDWAAFASSQQVAASYDANARRSKDVASAGGATYGVTQYSYDADGRIDCSATRMNPAVWSSLPASACTAQATGSAGPDRIVRQSYDAVGRGTKVQSAYGVTGVQSDQVTAAYSDNGQTLSVTDAEGNKTGYAYDGFDRLATTSYPSPTKGSGTVSSTDYEQLGYDANGNVTSRRLRDGSSIAYSYDNLNRLTLKDLPGSEPDVTYAYDLLGRPLSATSSAQTLSFTYDALDRNLTQVGPQGTVTSSYDVAGRRTQLTYPGGVFYVTYDYDVTGNVTAIKESGTTALATFAYDDLGRRTSLTRGNGVVTSYGYDGVSRLTSLGLDLAGTSDDLSLGFAYNPASQIASTTRSNDGYAWTGAATSTKAYTSNGLNQYGTAGGSSLSYDARGNTTAIGSAGYTYSSENLLLTGPNSAALIYDPLMRLYQTSASGFTTTRFAYDGQDLIEEHDGSNALLKRYVHGPGADEPLVEYDGSGTRTYLAADERGSVVSRSNASGAVTARNTYDEYGTPGASNVGTYGYTGQTWLFQIGLSYYKARMYAPALGRFLQTDPIGYGDGLNWYSYVAGDPINNRDPSGLQFFWYSYCPPTPPGASNGDGSADEPAPPITITALKCRDVYIEIPGDPFRAIYPSGSTNAPPSGAGDYLRSDDQQPPCVPSQSWLPQSGGIITGTSGAAGLANAGVYGDSSTAIGMFPDGPGAYESAGAGAVMGKNHISYPGSADRPTVNGAYAGSGAGAFVSNARNVGQLKGEFNTVTVNAWIFSISFSWGNGTWSLSGTVGPGGGLAVSAYKTNTYYTTSGCG